MPSAKSDLRPRQPAPRQREPPSILGGSAHTRGLLGRCSPLQEESVAEPGYRRVEDDAGTHAHVHQGTTGSRYQGDNQKTEHTTDRRAGNEDYGGYAWVYSGPQAG